MKISQLPQKVKVRALEYQKESKGKLVWNKTTDNLQHAFDWESSEEGYDYWIKWYEEDFIEEQIWKVTTKDTIVLSVMEDLNSRSILGVQKYKTTLDREDLSRKDWLQHAYEECLDQANYLKKLISLEK
jgi:hypothetical protein